VVLLLMAVPGVPVWALVLLLALAELAAPVTAAATAALLPDVLPDEDEYVLASGLTTTVNEVGQVLGYAVGGLAVVAVGVHGAFVLDAVTFALSAALLLRVRRRPAAAASGESVWRDAVEGLRAVAAAPRLRVLLPLAWLGCAASVVPEALAAPYAVQIGEGPVAVGWMLAAVPVGVVVGNLVVARWLPAARRDAAVLPLAVLAVTALAAVALRPALAGSLGLLLALGVGTAYYVLVAAVVAREVAPELRGRVFGLANTGLMLAQSGALLGAGLLADAVGAAAAMGLCGLLGLVGVLVLGLRWRSLGVDLAVDLDVDDDRGVVADALPLAGLPVDEGVDDAHRRRREDVVDAHPEVLVEHAGAVVPVGERAVVLAGARHDVDQAPVEQRAHGVALL
jgi:predicted MFS family arabinose efflux permease